MTSPRLRLGTFEDTELIFTLICELAEYERLSHEVVATVDSLRASLFGPGSHTEVLIAELDGQAVGIALYFSTYSTFLARQGIYLEDVFVRPEYRGRGVGKRLLIEVARTAVSRGCGRLEWAVLDWNTPAIGFYDQLGARPLSEWIHYRLTGEGLAALAAEG
jgi:GNAT superfamily N-acetyltransferase